MATQAQIDANRRNSQKSTGPRTAAGKAASSQNALRHGLYAEAAVIQEEDAAAFDDLQRAYLDSFDPQSPAETALVVELVRCDWLLRRTTALETQLWNRTLDDRREWLADNFDESVPLAIAYNQLSDRLNLIQRRLSALGRSYHRALHDLQRLQSTRAKSAPAAPSPAADAPIGFVPPQSPAPDPAPQLPIGFVPPIPPAARSAGAQPPAPNPPRPQTSTARANPQPLTPNPAESRRGEDHDLQRLQSARAKSPAAAPSPAADGPIGFVPPQSPAPDPAPSSRLASFPHFPPSRTAPAPNPPPQNRRALNRPPRVPTPNP